MLASNFPDIKKVVEAHSLGLLCDPDVESVTEMVKSLEAKEGSFSFKELSSLSWTKQEEKLVALYEGI